MLGGRYLTFNVEVGTLAAILTVFEYVLSTIAAISARASIHGLWLLRLHRGGSLPNDAKDLKRRAFRKDIFSFLLSVWLVAGVALLEANLRPSVRIKNRVIKSDHCVSVYGKYESYRTKSHVPPYRALVENWVLTAANGLNCGEYGIASIGTGGMTDSMGKRQNMAAPVCATEKVEVGKEIIGVKIDLTEVEDTYLKFEIGATAAYAILPYSSENLGKDDENIGISQEGKGICGERGISALHTEFGSEYGTTFVQYGNLSYALHERICDAHPGRVQSSQVIANTASPSWLHSVDAYIRVDVLRSQARSDQIFKYTISDAYFLFQGKKIDDPTYACTNGTMEIEYVFASAPDVARQLRKFRGQTAAIPTNPVLMQTSARMLEGHCERAIGPVSFAALLYSADAEWRNDHLAKVMKDKRMRYHMYAMAVSSAQFPLNGVQGDETPKNAEGECWVRPIDNVTKVKLDWRMLVMLIGFVVAFLVIGMSILFRCLFPGESWQVGSTMWSLRQFIDEDEEENNMASAVVEVFPMDDESAEKRRKQDAIVSKRSRMFLKNVDSFDDSLENGLALQDTKSIKFGYRVRTLRDLPGVSEKTSSDFDPGKLSSRGDDTIGGQEDEHCDNQHN